jgi:hypothetical protein
LLFLAGCGGQGKMPIDSAAAAVRRDALLYVKSVAAISGSSVKLPDSVERLRPLSSQTYSNGLLVIFQRRYVEEYGFYYCDDTAEPPEDIAAFCKKLSPGFYRYYNPG